MLKTLQLLPLILLLLPLKKPKIKSKMLPLTQKKLPIKP